MAFENNQVLVPGLTAAADYSSADHQYMPVYLSAKGVVTICTDDEQHPVGVLQNCPKQYEAATVCCFGFTKVQAEAVLAIGEYIGVADAGTVKAAVQTQFPFGQCIVPNVTAGGYATCFISCTGMKAVA